MENILTDIANIIKNTLEKPDAVIELTTTAEDIDEWDSLMHIQIIVAIEKELGVKFTASQIQRFKSVGDIVSVVKSNKGV